MRHISIKSFALATLLLIFASGTALFYLMITESRHNTEILFKDNIKANTLNLKHFLDKNLKNGNVNELISFLDNKAHTNPLIKNIYIFSREGKQIYSSNRLHILSEGNNKCAPISKLSELPIEQQRCYFFDVVQYNGLTPYSLRAYISLDMDYIHALISERINQYFYFAIPLYIVMLAALWILVFHIIIKPLEKLRHFSYYADRMPDEFLITEFESIRYSLALTFKRLKKEQKELFDLSTKDPLSGLSNRLSLIEKGNSLISTYKNSGSKFALLFLDLDNFKSINDIHGHEFGDKILIEVSSRILAAIRDQDITARLGGDEFVIILPDIKKDEEILDVIQNIQTKVSTPIELDNANHYITCSIGVTIYPKDGKDVSTLLKNADIAMYQAKETGKNTFHFFTKSLHETIQQKTFMQKLMRNAYEKGNFELYYQPKVDMKTNHITGCEALIRLNDPVQGLITPDHFIPVAEQNGFIEILGNWVIDEAVAQLKKWENTDMKDLKISINISGIQINNPSFFNKLREAVKEIDPTRLDIELTESILINDFEKIIDTIRKIQELGVTISLDDFGTGYSSLSYLKTVPFNTLKIDKSFIQSIDQEQGESFVKMIINIAKEIQMTLVAEGVETEAQYRYLREKGCDQYQGYYCAPALNVSAFEARFSTTNCPLIS